jgi:hypothetical protein
MNIRNAASVQSAHIEFLEAQLSKARRENRELVRLNTELQKALGKERDQVGGSISSKEPECPTTHQSRTPQSKKNT